MHMLGEREWQNFRDALATVESSNNPDAIGDSGQAFGRWQMHPAWVVRYRTAPTLDDTWDEYFQRCLRRFFDEQVSGQLILQSQLLTEDVLARVLRQAAMTFHTGRQRVEGEKGWDNTYDEKFTRALTEVTMRRARKSSVV